jgi:hypothetical protein
MFSNASSASSESSPSNSSVERGAKEKHSGAKNSHGNKSALTRPQGALNIYVTLRV